MPSKKAAQVVVPVSFEIDRFYEQILKEEYKSPDSQRKLRKFLDRVRAVTLKHIESQPVPTVVKKQLAESTLYSLSPEEILSALQEHANSPRFNEDPNNGYRQLHTALSDQADAMVIPYVKAERGRAAKVWEAAQFKAFNFEELSTKKGWSWRLKLAIHQEMKKVHHTYDIRLVLSPKDHWKTITTLQDEIQELMTNPQLAMDIDGERKARIEDREKRIEERKAAWETRLAACPDIRFEGTVKQVDYRDVRIEDDDGESMTIPGTILTLKIPGRTVEEMNAIREAINDYCIRLQPL